MFLAEDSWFFLGDEFLASWLKKEKRSNSITNACFLHKKLRNCDFGWNVVTFVLLPKVCLHLVALKEFLLNSFFNNKSSLLNAKSSLGWWVSSLTLINWEENTNEEREKVRTLLLDVVKQ